MKQQEIQARAYAVYASIGELTIKSKQLSQQQEQIEHKLYELEQEIVRLSQTTPTDLQDAADIDGGSNVD